MEREMEPLLPMYLLIGIVLIPMLALAVFTAARLAPTPPAQARPLRAPSGPVGGMMLGLGAAFVLAGLGIGVLSDAPGSGTGGLLVAASGVVLGGVSAAAAALAQRVGSVPTPHR